MKAMLKTLGMAVILVPSLVMAQTVERKSVNVPKVDPAAITIDGLMNESEWATAGSANLVTASGFEVFYLPYGRPEIPEPEYDEFVAKMLWSQETLFVFIHIDEFVNDSTGLYWDGQWLGDQLFVSLSNRLGRNLAGGYDGNVYAAPDGPYHFLVMADSVTLNASQLTYIPDEYKAFPDDTTRYFQASDIARWAIAINETTGEWDIEMAIYNPNINYASRLGFNIGGSTGSEANDTSTGDAYAYYTWQPSVVDAPFTEPANLPVGGDPGYYNLVNSDYWALLSFGLTSGPVNVEVLPGSNQPVSYALSQNYPNPFNPETHVDFAVPAQGRITVAIYNILGQRIATLFDGVRAAGQYQATWNAAKFGSGIYFARLSTESGIVLTRKLLLVK